VFRHVLLPTDGSELSEMAIRHGVRLAKENNAKVTGISVTPQLPAVTAGAATFRDAREKYVVEIQAQARRHLAILQKAAAEEGVTCETLVESSNRPHEAIIAAAEARGCDLILMASDGRHGVKELLLGSPTQKLLAHSGVPVLIYRQGKRQGREDE